MGKTRDFNRATLALIQAGICVHLMTHEWVKYKTLTEEIALCVPCETKRQCCLPFVRYRCLGIVVWIGHHHKTSVFDEF